MNVMSLWYLYATVMKSVEWSGDGLVGVEISFVLPYRPADASELVGKGDGGFVMPDAVLEFHRPALELIK